MSKFVFFLRQDTQNRPAFELSEIYFDFVLILGELFCTYFEKKKIIVNVAVTIKAPVYTITLDEFVFGASLISIFLPL